jgi:hypothetical protein
VRRHGFELVRWIDDRSLHRKEMKDYVTLATTSDTQQSVAVVPDGYVAIRAHGRIYHRFLEADLGTVTGHSTKDGRRDWARKCRAYLEYYRSGAFLKRYGARGLRVLTVTTSEQRLSTLRTVTVNAGGRQLFLFTTFARLAHADVLTDPIWQPAHDDELQPLIA